MNLLNKLKKGIFPGKRALALVYSDGRLVADLATLAHDSTCCIRPGPTPKRKVHWMAYCAYLKDPRGWYSPPQGWLRGATCRSFGDVIFQAIRMTLFWSFLVKNSFLKIHTFFKTTRNALVITKHTVLRDLRAIHTVCWTLHIFWLLFSHAFFST